MRKLATGGMAEVYLAKVAGPGGFEKHVVLKQILPALSDNELYVKMFLSEARLAAQLEHPNIVHVYDFGEADGSYYLTMEYVEGANLRQVLRWAIRNKHPFPPWLAARIIAQACEGLAYAHEFVPPGNSEVTRLVHRDVSPENIMLAKNGSVKMLDFGVAKSVSDDHRSKVGSLKGKIAYMPPEQVRGTGIDHRTDIYALGVVLYQTLSGKRPYGQATDVALITAILQDDPTPLMKHRLDLPDNLLNIVSRAMMKSPEKRFQSCADMRDALEAYIMREGQPASSAQVAALVSAYQAANPTEGTRSQPLAPPEGAGTSGSSGVSGDSSESGVRNHRPSGLRPALDKDADEPPGLISQLMTEAARANPPAFTGVLPEEPRTDPHAPSPGLEGVYAKTTPAVPGPFHASRLAETAALPTVTPAPLVAPPPAPPLPVVTATPVVAPPPAPPLPVVTAAPVAPLPPAPAPAPPLPSVTAAVAHAGPIPDPPAASRPSMPSVAAMQAPAAEAGPHAVRRWNLAPVAAEPIRQALRENLRADRSAYLLRKLPAVIARLADFSKSIPWSVSEALGGVLDAAALADDHQAIVRIIERAETRPGRDGRFANLVAHELKNPVRIAWLIERLRSGLPTDLAGLRSWLARLGPGSDAMLLDALEASEKGPAQELFAEALAHALPANPTPVTARLENPNLRTAAAFCFALERAQLPDRNRVFQNLIARREPALQAEVLTGRARARAADALPLLEGGLGDKSDEVRKRALELIGELGGVRGFQLLQRLMKDASFEARPVPERARFWASLLDCGADAALAELEQVIAQKPSLLGKKKVNDAKLVVIEGLSRARTEVARATLERVALDKGQADEVQAAARSALAGSRGTSGEFQNVELRSVKERRTHTVARIALDLTLLARASTTIDVGSGLLDAAIEQFRDGLRQLMQTDGRVQLFAEPVPQVNGDPVSFAPFHALTAAAVTASLKARDLNGFLVEAMLPIGEFRAFLLRAFDPDGKHERLPHVKAVNVAGLPLTPIIDGPLPADPTARAKELFAALVRWLHAQREALRIGKGLDVVSIDATLDELSRLMAAGAPRFLGVSRWQPGETGTLVHAMNTAMLSMAFANDLGLPRSAIRELLELTLMIGVAEAASPAERRPSPGEAPPEDERFHAAGLLITSRLNRLGTASSVAAIESGLSHDGSGKGPGLVASIASLCKAFDGLTAGTGDGAGRALEHINGRLRTRFSPDLLGMFTQWAFAQG